MRRTIANVAFLMIFFALQSCVFPFIPFLSAAPNLVLILTFSYGFIYGPRAGLIYGFMAGLFMDLFYSGAFGFFSLLFRKYVKIGRTMQIACQNVLSCREKCF